MKKIILHIGFGKTGSSYLQACFARHADLLREHGIYYPDGGSNQAAKNGKITSGNAQSLAKYLNPRNKLNIDVGSFEQEITTLLAKTTQPVLLFSSEFLSNFDADIMSDFQLLVEQLGYKLSIVCYVRSIAGHAYSNYSQRVKRHLCTDDFSYYIQHDYQMPFRGLLKRIDRCFDSSLYTIRNYDKVRGYLWQDFIQGVLGLDDERLDVGENQLINRSLDTFEIEFMRTFNRYLPDERHGFKVSDALIYADSDRPVAFVLEEEESRLLLARYAESLVFINRFLPAEQQLAIIGPEFVVGEREKPVVDRFQQAMISVMASLIAAK